MRRPSHRRGLRQQTQKRLLVALTSACFALALVSMAMFSLHLFPRFEPVTYRFDTGEEGEVALPFSVPSRGENMVVTIPVRVSPLFRPSILHITPDDCLTDLRLNGVAVPHEEIC